MRNKASQSVPTPSERRLIKAPPQQSTGCLSFLTRRRASEPLPKTFTRQGSWFWSCPKPEEPKLPPPPLVRPVRVHQSGLLRVATTDTLASMPYLVKRLDKPCVVLDIDDTLLGKGSTPCESTTASVVNQLQERGVPLFCLTSRLPEKLPVTLKQLSRAQIDPSRTVPWADGLDLRAQEVNFPHEGRRMVKPEGASGVVCVGGSKGAPLQDIVQQYGLRSVIVVDDSLKQLSSVSSVAQACQIPVMCVLYTGGMQDEKKAQSHSAFARFREHVFAASSTQTSL